MTIDAALANVVVDDVDRHLPLYQALAGIDEPVRFAFADLDLAIVGSFLLIGGAVENHPRQVASLVVSSIAEVTEALETAGAEKLEGPAPSANAAHRIVARHSDGSVFEYLQLSEGGGS